MILAEIINTLHAQKLGVCFLYMRHIYLKGLKGKGKFALIDDEDYLKVSCYKWYLSTHGYPITKNDRTRLIHRTILNIDDKNKRIDHIDGNPLNNQKSNLRFSTQRQNTWNMAKRKNKITSKFKGVRVFKNKWGIFIQSRIQVNGKRIALGNFKTEKEAARAYDAAANKYFGEFARLNFK